MGEERERLLSFVEDDNFSLARSRIARFYSVDEIGQLEAFKSVYNSEVPQRSNSLLGTGYGPWGISTERGGSINAWDEIDASVYNVRGPQYLQDKKKQPSGPALAELAVVDLFSCDTDVANAAACPAAKTIQRLRRSGESRMLLVLNFRLCPLHVIIVWAIPPASPSVDGPSRQLLDRFLLGMSDEERNQRLKVIPRILTGPWPIRKLIGENSAAILGRGIPISYFRGENELEISVSIAASRSAQRVSKAMLRGASAIELEVGLVIEGKTPAELPEQLLGGFRVAHADLQNVRIIDAEMPLETESESLSGFISRNSRDNTASREPKTPPQPSFKRPAHLPPPMPTS